MFEVDQVVEVWMGVDGYVMFGGYFYGVVYVVWVVGMEIGGDVGVVDQWYDCCVYVIVDGLWVEVFVYVGIEVDFSYCLQVLFVLLLDGVMVKVGKGIGQIYYLIDWFLKNRYFFWMFFMVLIFCQVCYFIVIVEFGQIFQVVIYLNILQLVVISVIQELESMFGVVLFICMVQGMNLIDSGWYFFNYVYLIQYSVDDVFNSL